MNEHELTPAQISVIAMFLSHEGPGREITLTKLRWKSGLSHADARDAVQGLLDLKIMKSRIHPTLKPRTRLYRLRQKQLRRRLVLTNG